MSTSRTTAPCRHCNNTLGVPTGARCLWQVNRSLPAVLVPQAHTKALLLHKEALSNQRAAVFAQYQKLSESVELLGKSLGEARGALEEKAGV